MSRSPTAKKTEKSHKKPAASGARGRGGRRPAARVPKAAGRRNLPRQQRSTQMVEAILQAAAELFAELGYARTTTNKVAARAGVSVGSLYQYFSNKDSLLAALLDEHHAQAHAVVAAGLERLADPRTPVEQGLRALLVELVALHEADPALTRALAPAVLSQATTPALHDRRGPSQDQAVAALLAARPDVRAGDRAVMAAVLGQTTEHLTRWLVHDAPPDLDHAVVLEEVVRLLARYLERAPGRGRAPRSPLPGA